jgi:hypothetical protein
MGFVVSCGCCGVEVEFSGILAYAEDADEFVRLSCREFAGWRRDEWAYSPLFICGIFP